MTRADRQAREARENDVPLTDEPATEPAEITQLREAIAHLAGVAGRHYLDAMGVSRDVLMWCLANGGELAKNVEVPWCVKFRLYGVWITLYAPIGMEPPR